MLVVQHGYRLQQLFLFVDGCGCWGTATIVALAAPGSAATAMVPLCDVDVCAADARTRAREQAHMLTRMVALSHVLHALHVSSFSSMFYIVCMSSFID